MKRGDLEDNKIDLLNSVKLIMNFTPKVFLPLNGYECMISLISTKFLMFVSLFYCIIL